MKKSSLKPAFRIQLKEFVENRLEKTIELLDNIQRSREMLRFYIENIVSILSPGYIPEDEDDLEVCFVDGPRDLDLMLRSERLRVELDKFRIGGLQS